MGGEYQYNNLFEVSKNKIRQSAMRVSIPSLSSCQVVIFGLTSDTVLVPNLQELA